MPIPHRTLAWLAAALFLAVAVGAHSGAGAANVARSTDACVASEGPPLTPDDGGCCDGCGDACTAPCCGAAPAIAPAEALLLAMTPLAHVEASALAAHPDPDHPALDRPPRF